MTHSTASTHRPSFLAQALLAWYPRHRRDLPWRHTRDPYAIWLSEVILQQTRVAQGSPYYLDFLTSYPTVHDLAAAPEQEVLRHWQGLGYYSRARNMHHTAQQVVSEFGGQFPATYAGLRQLKGVGPYTAAAIASFAFDEAVAVLDGNVFRVLARIFGLHSDIAAPASRKEFQAVADQHLPPAHAADFNQAIMEFGALQCTPAKPDCLFCPLQSECWAFQHGQVALLPIKSKAKAARTRYFHYFVLRHGEQLYLKERLSGDIWQGLYDFALAETDAADMPAAEVLRHVKALGSVLTTSKVTEGRPAPALRHILSHQKIEARFHALELAAALPETTQRDTGLRAYSAAEIEALPKSALINNYLAKAL
ncbi:A/G-specific adenine glycosylase [Hymenobacter sp. HMF4947]|uniref:Adenine DNA glycosylase n=1 Tax=Hymenobacter ginkgonis TaxID=2682976 RepID=A0A7K1THW3_9BACT|nr:A/G-specific adenine glycosylase [Hymenobacter ginkgonis]